MAAARAAWIEEQPVLDPNKLVFIDETGANMKMARLRGRAPRGQRCVAAIPHGHWLTTTLTAGLRVGKMTAPMLLSGPMDRMAFLAYVEQVLVPDLAPGEIVIMDMCGRRGERVGEGWALLAIPDAGRDSVAGIGVSCFPNKVTRENKPSKQDVVRATA